MLAPSRPRRAACGGGLRPALTTLRAVLKAPPSVKRRNPGPAHTHKVINDPSFDPQIMNFGARLSLAPQAEACSRTEDGPDRSITVTRQNSAGPIGARHRRYVWNSCCGPHLGSGLVRPHQQTGHMAAIASIRNRIPPSCQQGAVHIWVPAQGWDDSGVCCYTII